MSDFLKYIKQTLSIYLMEKLQADLYKHLHYAYTRNIQKSYQ